MDDLEISAISQLISEEDVTDYSTWKQRRIYLVDHIGSHLLSLSEDSLPALFAAWISEIKSINQQQVFPFKELLLIAVYTYFRPNPEDHKGFISHIDGFLESPDRDVCRVAAKLLYYNACNLEFQNRFSHNLQESQKFFNDTQVFNGITLLAT